MKRLFLLLLVMLLTLSGCKYKQAKIVGHDSYTIKNIVFHTTIVQFDDGTRKEFAGYWGNIGEKVSF